MARGSYVSDSHQNTFDGSFEDGQNGLENSYNGEESERLNNIHIEVKVVNRKESSIDTNYEDYLHQFSTEEYLSQIGSSDETGIARTKVEESCSNSVILSQHQSSGCQVQDTGCDPIDTLSDVEEIQKYAPGTEFWYGYGGNIYFQPLMCKTLPRIRVKSKAKLPQVHILSKRTNFNTKRQSYPMCFRLDIPASKSALENVGTLRVVDNSRTGKRLLKGSSNGRTDETRVGNFVMSEDLKVRLCKGFVCRNTDKSAPLPKGRTHREFTAKDDGVYIKASMRPIRLDSRELCFGKKVKRTNVNFGEKNGMLGALENQDFFDLFPRMSSAPNLIDKTPRKKKIAGKSFYLTTSSQTINKINLSPFNQPLVYKESIVEKSPEKPLHPSPDIDEDKSIKHLEEKVVTDHLQEMESHGNFEPTNIRNVSNEEQYAYESLFSYYNAKVKDVTTKTGGLKNALVTRSLISSHQKSRENPIKSQYLDNGSKYASDKKIGNERKLKAANDHGAKHSVIHVAGKELNVPGKTSVLNDVEGREKISALGRCDDFGSRSLFTLVDENMITGCNQDNSSSSDDEVALSSSSFDLNHRGTKAVHFKDDEKFWATEITSYKPFIAKAARPVDRYEIPSSKACRLPIIGQKMSTNST